jgi:hypothetical protein
VQSIWLQDARILRSTVNGKTKYTLRIPEAFMRTLEVKQHLNVALYLENGSLKVVPYEEE